MNRNNIDGGIAFTEQTKRIISIVGAGGKTTLLHQLAERYRREHRSVLATTTTHMMVEEGMELSCDILRIRRKLETDGYCLAGTLCACERCRFTEENNDYSVKKDYTNRKFTALPEPVFREAIAAADVVLIEADGAKGMYAKYPREDEPVLTPMTTEIIIVMGLECIGKAASEAVFRFERMEENDQTVTLEYLMHIIEKGYLTRIRQDFPETPVQIIFAANRNGRRLYYTFEEAEKYSIIEMESSQ